MPDGEGIVRKVDEFFTEEALRENDGKTVPLRREFGGPIIGEATLEYDENSKALKAAFRIDDPKVKEFLEGPAPSHVFRDPPPRVETYSDSDPLLERWVRAIFKES